MSLNPQETPAHRICAATSRPRMFLTSAVYSRYGLEATGQARCGPLGKAADVWEKTLPSHAELPRL